MGLGWGLEQEAGLGEKLAAVASVPWRSEAGLGGRQNRVRWRIGRQNALEAGLGEWWRRVTASQGLGRWVWMEIRVWTTSCCTPEAWECTGCFRRLNGAPHEWTNQGQDRTEGRERRKEAAVMHTEGKDSRSGKREGRRKGGKKRRGQMKQENPAQSYNKVLLLVLCIFLG